MMVASYCRVSTDGEDQANSFQAQQRYFRTYIGQHTDWELYEVYADEGITGTSTKRRVQFRRMMDDAYAGKFQLILTKEVSRFSRNILDAIAYTRELRSIGVGVQFLLDGINTLRSDAELYLSMMASIAQEESRKTSCRVVWGQTRQMERGVVFGPSLLGYTVSGGRLTVEPDGAETVRLIFRKYALEQVSTAQLARFLTGAGYRTGGGSHRWRASAVVKILKNEKYVGDLVQRKTYTPDYLTHEKRANRGAVPLITLRNHHEPLISRALWQLAQERLRRNDKHRAEQTGQSNRYIFSGKIRCGICGSSFVGRTRARKDGTQVRCWRCGRAAREGAAACGIGRLIRDDEALYLLKTALARLSIDPSALAARVAALAVDAIRAEERGLRAEPQRLARELEEVQRRREAVLDSYFARELARSDLETMLRRYDARREDLLRRQAEALRREQDGTDAVALREELQAAVRSLLRGETESEAFLKAMLDHLTVFPDRRVELRLAMLPHIFTFTG